MDLKKAVKEVYDELKSRNSSPSPVLVVEKYREGGWVVCGRVQKMADESTVRAPMYIQDEVVQIRCLKTDEEYLVDMTDFKIDMYTSAEIIKMVRKFGYL